MKTTRTKEMKGNYERYLQSSNGNSLYYVYKIASPAKWRGWDYCQDLMRKYNGHNGKVISGNTFKFTFGFVGEYVDEKTGEVVPAYYHITADYDRVMPLA